MPQDSPLPDRIRLRHMLEAARQATEFASGRTRADLDSDAMFRRAVVHCLQEIGEAASQVGESTRATVTGIPWRQIVGMRHNLVHVYFDIKHELVWKVVSQDLGPLMAVLDAALAAKPGPKDADDKVERP
jgi:uncharacterized protein with HEPN domain